MLLYPLDEERGERLLAAESIRLGPDSRVLHLHHAHDLERAAIGR